MKKWMKTMVIVATLIIAFGTVGSVYAQGRGPGAVELGEGQGYGAGIPGGRGERRNRDEKTAQGTMDGVLHDAFMAAYAEALGITVEELEAQLSEGNSLADIAQSNGYTLEDFWALKQEIRTSVIEQAVADGTLPDELAGRMSSRGPGNRSGQGFGGRGFGFSDCPYNEVED